MLNENYSLYDVLVADQILPKFINIFSVSIQTFCENLIKIDARK